MRKETKL